LCHVYHLSQLKCKGALNIFIYFFQQITNGSNTSLIACMQKKNSWRALLLLLLASSIIVNLNCLKFHCVPSLPPTTLVCWVLVAIVICGEREDDATTLVWCMGANQLMMGDDEPAGLGHAASSATMVVALPKVYSQLCGTILLFFWQPLLILLHVALLYDNSSSFSSFSHC
jgi:hypothetical protein